MSRSSDDDARDQENDERDPHDPETAGEARARRSSFAIVLIVLLGAWKAYEAVVAPTMRAAIPPSLYTAGLGAFAVSLLGPRRVQLATFFAGAMLCLLAIAVETSY